MSAFGGKADITQTCTDVCFGPKADMRPEEIIDTFPAIKTELTLADLGF